MGDVKRNQWVIVLVLAAFALMVWSGYANYKRRKQYAQRQAQGTLVPENANNQSVQQDVAADEGLPDLRGKRAPDFSLRTVEGKKVSLADYKGKAVLINFWATWCAPCKIEMPWLVALRSQYAGQGFEILASMRMMLAPRGRSWPNSARSRVSTIPCWWAMTPCRASTVGSSFFPPPTLWAGTGRLSAETAGLVSKSEVEASIKKALAAGGK